MLFWLIVVVCLIGLGALIIGINGDKFCSNDKSGKLSEFIYYHDEGIAIAGGVTLFIFILVLTFMICEICYSHTNAPATIARYNETYKALTYKLESGACRDELGLLNKSVIDEIQDWNENIVTQQAQQREFWLGIFIPDIYDQFKTIDYTLYNSQVETNK